MTHNDAKELPKILVIDDPRYEFVYEEKMAGCYFCPTLPTALEFLADVQDYVFVVLDGSLPNAEVFSQELLRRKFMRKKREYNSILFLSWSVPGFLKRLSNVNLRPFLLSEREPGSFYRINMTSDHLFALLMADRFGQYFIRRHFVGLIADVVPRLWNVLLKGEQAESELDFNWWASCDRWIHWLSEDGTPTCPKCLSIAIEPFRTSAFGCSWQELRCRDCKHITWKEVRPLPF